MLPQNTSMVLYRSKAGAACRDLQQRRSAALTHLTPMAAHITGV